MSTINTNSIDANYPIPGQNNSTQGFRNNFASIKQNLDIAGSEITELQTNTVLKSPLANSSVNNNMGNTLISNASIQGFRSTTYNLGNALTDAVTIDLSLGDVQYGNLAGNVILRFGNWAPTNTQSNVTIQIGRPNNQADFTITFPAEAVFSENYGWPLIENSSDPNSLSTLSFPYDVTQLNLLISTVDCGDTLYVTPINRPMQSRQIVKRTPPLTGQLGDVVGTTCVSDVESIEIPVTGSNANNFLITANTVDLYTGMPVTFTGNSFEPNIVTGATYYVGNIANNNTHFTISTSPDASGNVDLIGSTGNMNLNPVSYMYIAVDNYASNSYNVNVLSTVAPNSIVVNPANTTHIAVGSPVIFSGVGTANANITPNVSYYVKSLNSGTGVFTVSRTVDNGIPGPTYEGVLSHITDTTFAIDFDVYEGRNIFRRVPLIPGSSTTTSADIPNVSDIRIGGGNNGYFLVTDGTGNLSWSVAGAYNSISNISNIQTIVSPIGTQITTVEDHGLTEGAGVTITNVGGMTQLNGNLYYANVVTSNVFLLYTDPSLTTPVNSSSYSPYTSGGKVTSSLGLVAGSNTQVQFNNAGTFGAAAGFTFNQASGLLSVPGSVTATANINSNNVNITNNLSVGNIANFSGNVNIAGNTLLGDVQSGGNIVANGNIIANGLYALSLISSAGNAVIGNITVSNSANVGGAVFCTGVQANGNSVFANIEATGQVAISGNIFSNSNVLSNSFFISAVQTGIVATGSTQGDAQQLTKSINVIQNVPPGSGVLLPNAFAGLQVIIRNVNANTVKVYPSTGCIINDIAAVNVPVTVAANTSLELFCAVGGASGQWYTL